MKCIFKYILVPLVGVFFMLSACEISTKYFTNTFDDEYDVYVLPDNINLSNIAIDLITDPVLFEDALLPVPADVSILCFRTGLTYEACSFHPPLYLSNRILLI
jgi:hypothetical protein